MDKELQVALTLLSLLAAVVQLHYAAHCRDNLPSACTCPVYMSDHVTCISRYSLWMKMISDWWSVQTSLSF